MKIHNFSYSSPAIVVLKILNTCVLDSDVSEFKVLFMVFRAFAKLQVTVSFIMYVCPPLRPYGTTQLPLDKSL